MHRLSLALAACVPLFTGAARSHAVVRPGFAGTRATLRGSSGLRREARQVNPESKVQNPKSAIIRGFAMQLTNPRGLPAYKRAIVHMRALGCRWLEVVVDADQKNVLSPTVHFNWRHLPSAGDIRRILRFAHRNGMKTMLMPIVLLRQASSTQWRGVIQPPSWRNWFFGYEKFILRCANWAQRCHVAVFSVGSELLSTENFQRRWLRIIRRVRQTYSGKLTYSANWDHYTVPQFWNKLDYIGMNDYHKLARHPGISVPHIVRDWAPIKKAIFAFARKEHKPVLLTEVGWHNLQNTLVKPWDYVGNGPIDPREQLHAYEAFVKVWSGLPTKRFAGAFIWEWMPGAKPTEHGSYSLQGEPALPVVEKWIRGGN